MRPDVPRLRKRRFVHELERSFASGCERGEFRLVHYSILGNHAHLLVEASDRHALARGMMSLGARFSRTVNRVFARKGRVLEDRYHVSVLRTPSQVRNALRYVLLSARHHSKPASKVVKQLDPASSADHSQHDRSKRMAPPVHPVLAARLVAALRKRSYARARTSATRVRRHHPGLALRPDPQREGPSQQAEEHDGAPGTHHR